MCIYSCITGGIMQKFFLENCKKVLTSDFDYGIIFLKVERVNTLVTIQNQGKEVENMNRKNLFSIFYKTENASLGRYANADKFIHCATVTGEQAKQEKLEELKNAGVKIDSVYNGIGEKIKF